PDALVALDHLLDDGDALFGAEQASLARVVEDRNGEVGIDAGSAPDQVHMPVVKGIEAAWVHGSDHPAECTAGRRPVVPPALHWWMRPILTAHARATPRSRAGWSCRRGCP